MFEGCFQCRKLGVDWVSGQNSSPSRTETIRLTLSLITGINFADMQLLGAFETKAIAYSAV